MKGTGTWTVQTALTLGIPVTGIAEAVFARGLSSSKTQRAAAAGKLPGPNGSWEVKDRDEFVENVRLALYASKIVAYAQGFDEIVAGAAEYGWDIDRGAVARIWRGGCIIRARFLNRITEAYAENPTLGVAAAGAVLHRRRRRRPGRLAHRWSPARPVSGIPTPVFASSLAYYDGLRTERLPAALIQGQRDFFGAHTYQRIDKDGTFHTLWSGDRTEVERVGRGALTARRGVHAAPGCARMVAVRPRPATRAATGCGRTWSRAHGQQHDQHAGRQHAGGDREATVRTDHERMPHLLGRGAGDGRRRPAGRREDGHQHREAERSTHLLHHVDQARCRTGVAAAPPRAERPTSAARRPMPLPMPNSSSGQSNWP